VWSATEDRSALLRRCYDSSLIVAAELGAKSVAFPLISSGVYRWPKDDAVLQALTALRTAPPVIELVRLVLFDDDTKQVADIASGTRYTVTAPRRRDRHPATTDSYRGTQQAEAAGRSVPGAPHRHTRSAGAIAASTSGQCAQNSFGSASTSDAADSK
jgi:hypothetical protein